MIVGIASLVLGSMLAKKPKRAPLEEPTDGDLPWFLTVEEDQWNRILVDLSEGIEKSKTKEKEWSCYLITFTDEESGETFEKHEVPFWAMKAFHAAIKSAYDDGDEDIILKYKRTVKGKVNTATFRGV